MGVPVIPGSRRRARAHVAVLAVACFAASVLVTASVEHVSALPPGPDPHPVTVATDLNPDPDILEVSITAEEAEVDVGNGVTATMWTFNGTVPGPELRLTVGQRVIVRFTNELPEATGIHWHGIELANESDGTPLTQNQVPTNGAFIYDFTVTRPGIFWYHPHHHSSTNQVFRGLYGSIVVTDDEGHESTLVDEGVLPGPADTKTVVLSDVTVCHPGNNPTDPYPNDAPWVGGTPLPDQGGQNPALLCDTPMDDHGDPLVPGPSCDGNAPTGALCEGDVPNTQPNLEPPLGGNKRVNEGVTVLANGVNAGPRAGDPGNPGDLGATAQTLGVLAGQGLRLQLINAATTRYFRLLLTDAAGDQVDLVRVGGEGGLIDEARLEGGMPGGFDTEYAEGEIVMGPGDRADVVVAIPSDASGVLTLWTQDFGRSGGGAFGFVNIPTVPVMHFEVDGQAGETFTIDPGDPVLTHPAVAAPVEQLPDQTEELLDPTDFGETGTDSHEIRLTAVVNQALGVDDVQGAHDFPGDYTGIDHFDSARYATAGDVFELTINNTTTAHHPFHLHGFSIQPLSFTRENEPTFEFPYAEFMDNIDIPARYTLTLRVRTDERPHADGITPGGLDGRWVFHCHIFFHATNGMISEVVVTNADGNERPHVDVPATSVGTQEGSPAPPVNGTFSDPDGDPVTFVASAGAVADNGDGTWTWNHVPPDGPLDDPWVFVTAIDSEGNTDQTSFELGVANLPPDLGAVSVPAAPATVGMPVSVSAPFTDPGTGDTHTALIDWGDGSIEPGVVVEAAGAGTISGSHAYASAGSFTVTVEVTDDDGASDSSTAASPIVVYPVMTGRALGGSLKVGSVGSVLGDTGSHTSAGSLAVSRQTATVNIGPVSVRALSGDLTFTAVADPLASRSHAVGRVDRTVVDLLPFGLLRLEIRGVTATSTSTCAGSSASDSVSGITLNGVTVLGTTKPAPNTVLNLGLVRVELNTQSTGPGGLTVTGARVVAPGVDLVLAQARSGIDCGPPPVQLAAKSLLGSDAGTTAPVAKAAAAAPVALLAPSPYEEFCRLPIP